MKTKRILYVNKRVNLPRIQNYEHICSKHQSPKIYEQNWTGLKGEIDSSAVIFLIIDRIRHK